MHCKRNIGCACPCTCHAIDIEIIALLRIILAHIFCGQGIGFWNIFFESIHVLVARIGSCKHNNVSRLFTSLIIGFAHKVLTIMGSAHATQANANHAWFLHTIGIGGDIFHRVGNIHIFKRCKSTQVDVTSWSYATIITIFSFHALAGSGGAGVGAMRLIASIGIDSGDECRVGVIVFLERAIVARRVFLHLIESLNARFATIIGVCFVLWVDTGVDYAHHHIWSVIVFVKPIFHSFKHLVHSSCTASTIGLQAHHGGHLHTRHRS